MPTTEREWLKAFWKHLTELEERSGWELHRERDMVYARLCELDLEDGEGSLIE